jgi:hypothetical protein
VSDVTGIATGGVRRQISALMTPATMLFGRWATAVAWVILPIVAGPSFGDALDPRTRSVQLVA